MQLQEVNHGGGQLGIGQGHAAGDAQLAAQRALLLGGLLLHVVHQRQHLLAAAQAVFARIRERDAARGALQQARTQPLFQLGHITRHHGARHVQLIGRGAKAAAVRHLHKYLHGG